MDSLALARSRALNNIPKPKLYTKIAGVLEACDVCSKKDVNIGKSLEVGLCEKCRYAVTAYNRYFQSNIPIEYWDLKMDRDFVGYSGLLNKYNEYSDDLKTAYITGSSICFAGSHGLGKTMTTTCILKKASQKGYNCLYTTLSDVVNVLTAADSEEKFLARKELTMVDFLVIDEFDSRFIATDNAADLYARTLEGVFRTRSQNKLPTLMCTNSPNILETFSGALKQSIGSLMKGYLKIFPVLGEDHRPKLGLVKDGK